jgi:predicted transcriptional regulator
MIRKFENTRQLLQNDDYSVYNKLKGGREMAIFELCNEMPELKRSRIRSALHKLGLHNMIIKTDKKVINPETSAPMFKYKSMQE